VKGLFITFEGPDGSGKTTQMQRLGYRLQSLGKEVVRTREPGGTAIGNHIRELLLSPESSSMIDETEVLLYAASRAQHVRELIIPALGRGAIVICDRFIDASLAYQGYGLGQPLAQIKAINHYASMGIQPRRTYMIDVPVEISRQRLLNRAAQLGNQPMDRIEQKELSYHQRVREGFLQIAEEASKRVLLLNGNQDEATIAEEIFMDYEVLIQEK
jgi:dTMP kinase